MRGPRWKPYSSPAAPPSGSNGRRNTTFHWPPYPDRAPADPFTKLKARIRALNHSNGLHGNGRQVVYQPDFFLQKGLRVFDAREQAIKAGHGGDPLANFRMRGEVPLPGFLVRVLRLIGVDGLQA